MKLAIIGASSGQLPLCLKAKEMGLETICFAWAKGAICKDFVDRYYPISIADKDNISLICKEEKIDGIVSNASDATAEVVSYIATALGLHGIDHQSFLGIMDKARVRSLVHGIKDLADVPFTIDTCSVPFSFPYVIKPRTGASKKGVYYVEDADECEEALSYIRNQLGAEALIEQFVTGREISVETLSFEGEHHVLQITDKVNGGPPHFVELAHHQPALLSDELRERIVAIVPHILDAVSYRNGASHVELKVDSESNIRLVEINPRGGGDEISSKLVELSTGYDYIKGMIEVSLGHFLKPKKKWNMSAGIYYLCKQSEAWLPAFTSSTDPSWLIEKEVELESGLRLASGNYDRNGYLIYQSERKIIL